MPIANTSVEVIMALISLVSCIIAIISAFIAWKNSRSGRESEFYCRKDKLIKIRDEILVLNDSTDYSDNYVNRLSLLIHNYVDELDDICKRFPYKMIIQSDLENDLIYIKNHPDYFGDIYQSPNLKKALDKLDK